MNDEIQIQILSPAISIHMSVCDQNISRISDICVGVFFVCVSLTITLRIIEAKQKKIFYFETEPFFPFVHFFECVLVGCLVKKTTKTIKKKWQVVVNF